MERACRMNTGESYGAILFLARVRVDVNQYKSADELMDRWLAEAEAAEGAEQAGLIVTLWKDVSAPLVYGVLCVEGETAIKANATLLETVMGLPMGQDGALVFEDVTEVRPYSEWRTLLRERRG